MKNVKVIWGGILIAVIIAVGGYYFPQVKQILGATGTRFPNGVSADTTSPIAGQVRGTTLAITGASTFTGSLTSNGGVVYGGVFATSSTGSVTYTAASLTGIDTVLHTNAGATTATLPASTTLSSFLSSTPGTRRSIVWVNQGTTALTLADGSGTLIRVATSTVVAANGIPPGGGARAEFVRKTNTDIVVELFVTN